jgi:hypothetical protein
MGLLYFLASETYQLCRKLYARIRPNRTSEGQHRASGNKYQTKLHEVLQILQQAQQLTALEKKDREAHIYIIFAKVGLETIIKDKETPEDIKKMCETGLCAVLELEKDVVKSATRVVRNLSYSKNDWKTNMEGVKNLNQIITLLDRLLYVNPADELANQFLNSQVDANLEPEIEKKRELVKKEQLHFVKKYT